MVYGCVVSWKYKIHRVTIHFGVLHWLRMSWEHFPPFLRQANCWLRPNKRRLASNVNCEFHVHSRRCVCALCTAMAVGALTFYLLRHFAPEVACSDARLGRPWVLRARSMWNKKLPCSLATEQTKKIFNFLKMAHIKWESIRQTGFMAATAAHIQNPSSMWHRTIHTRES